MRGNVHMTPRVTMNARDMTDWLQTTIMEQDRMEIRAIEYKGKNQLVLTMVDNQRFRITLEAIEPLKSSLEERLAATVLRYREQLFAMGLGTDEANELLPQIEESLALSDEEFLQEVGK